MNFIAKYPLGSDLKRIQIFLMVNGASRSCTQPKNAVPKSLSTVLYRRLNLLCQANLLQKIPCPYETTHNYALTEYGLAEVNQEQEKPYSLAGIPADPRKTKHRLLISRTMFSFELGFWLMRRTGKSCKWDIQCHFRIPLKDDSHLIADLGIAYIPEHENKKYMPLEVDCGTETLNAFSDKIRRYISAFAKYSQNDFVLLITAPSLQRIKGICRITMQTLAQQNAMEFANKCLFTTQDSLLQQENVLTASIWLAANDMHSKQMATTRSLFDA